MSKESFDKLPRLTNLWEKEAAANSITRPKCDCFDRAALGCKRPGFQMHTDQQDTESSGWHRLNELIETAARDGREEFSPGPEMLPQQWAQITVLPASIGKLKAVKHLNLYGSSLVRIPPEIGEMESLEQFSPYTSYRLHWFPYELMRCKRLIRSTISTRALYGASKDRWPFPQLPQLDLCFIPSSCSVCQKPFDGLEPIQRWISLPIGKVITTFTDVVPLLVHACSNECLGNLPLPPESYLQYPHCGGAKLKQPPTDWDCMMARRSKST